MVRLSSFSAASSIRGEFIQISVNSNTDSIHMLSSLTLLILQTSKFNANKKLHKIFSSLYRQNLYCAEVKRMVEKGRDYVTQAKTVKKNILKLVGKPEGGDIKGFIN